MKEYLKCPLFKELGIKKESIEVNNLYSQCYKEYLTCPIKNCPRRLV